MTITPQYECIETIFPNSGVPSYRRYLDTGEFREEKRKGFHFSNITGLLNIMFGTNKNWTLTRSNFEEWYDKNKSFEVLWKTIEDETEFKVLASLTETESRPANKILNIKPEELKKLEELKLVPTYVKFKRNYLDASNFPICYSPSRWISIMEKCLEWENDLTFNGVSWGQYGDSGKGTLFLNLMDDYSKMSRYSSITYQETPVNKRYNFPRFAQYVIEGAQDQGFTRLGDFVQLLKDYLRMAEEYSVTPTLYSNTLQMTHDILARNHKLVISLEDELKFKEKYVGFKAGTYGNYIIVCPEKTNDLLEEGDYLNHCVFSYVKRVINGENLVFFLREKEKPNIPFITVELRDGKIVQARGMHNNSIGEEYINILKKYAEDNGMEVVDML